MKVELKRLTPPDRTWDTLGLLFLDGIFVCFTLEDRYREKKIPSSTRIPSGTFNLTLRTYGRHHEKYLLDYSKDWHKGMILLEHVPGFTDILVHIGNTAGDTEGCILVGSGIGVFRQDKPLTVLSSTVAYTTIYPLIRDAILKEPTYIVITDSVSDFTY
jgi:hypothetical protein